MTTEITIKADPHEGIITLAKRAIKIADLLDVRVRFEVGAAVWTFVDPGDSEEDALKRYKKAEERYDSPSFWSGST